MLKYNKALKHYSRELRNNLTDAEKFLWDKVRGKQLKGCQFYRQKIIDNCIVDFYCPKAGLVIELDGGLHYTEDGIAKDIKRDKYIESLCIKVIRFSDREVFEDIEVVLEKIWSNL